MYLKKQIKDNSYDHSAFGCMRTTLIFLKIARVMLLKTDAKLDIDLPGELVCFHYSHDTVIIVLIKISTKCHISACSVLQDFISNLILQFYTTNFSHKS
jgi:hypothetical protein